MCKLGYGPIEQTPRDGHVLLIDVGTIAHLRAGHIAVRSGVAALTTTGVRFDDGIEEAYDAVVAGTGYRPSVADFLDAPDVLDAAGAPTSSGREAAPGLYFRGFYVSPIGMLKQIGIEARAIARAVDRSAAGR